MKIHGWCSTCRKVRRVRVTHWLGRGAPVGVCDDCEAKRGR